jgi:hypothetical protein
VVLNGTKRYIKESAGEVIDVVSSKADEIVHRVAEIVASEGNRLVGRLQCVDQLENESDDRYQKRLKCLEREIRDRLKGASAQPSSSSSSSSSSSDPYHAMKKLSDAFDRKRRAYEAASAAFEKAEATRDTYLLDPSYKKRNRDRLDDILGRCEKRRCEAKKAFVDVRADVMKMVVRLRETSREYATASSIIDFDYFNPRGDLYIRDLEAAVPDRGRVPNKELPDKEVPDQEAQPPRRMGSP